MLHQSHHKRKSATKQGCCNFLLKIFSATENINIWNQSIPYLNSDRSNATLGLHSEGNLKLFIRNNAQSHLRFPNKQARTAKKGPYSQTKNCHQSFQHLIDVIEQLYSDWTTDRGGPETRDWSRGWRRGRGTSRRRKQSGCAAPREGIDRRRGRRRPRRRSPPANTKTGSVTDLRLQPEPRSRCTEFRLRLRASKLFGTGSNISKFLAPAPTSRSFWNRLRNDLA